jgi:oxygen-independent coproporphyrinogen-3 oxidase
MLEVDEDSRLGRELIAGGTRYHAHHVPNEDMTADFYLQACETLNAAGLQQYEISNFACSYQPRRLDENRRTDESEAEWRAPEFPCHASRHNLKYWLRHPYLGFGVDAHSMLCSPQPGQAHAAVRFATTDNLDALLANAQLSCTSVSEKNSIEELYFLGLRLNRGIELAAVKEQFGIDAVDRYRPQITEFTDSGLLTLEGGWLRLTNRGRLLSNDVFSAFLTAP